MTKRFLLGSAIAASLLTAGCGQSADGNATATDVTLNDEGVALDANVADLNTTDYAADGNASLNAAQPTLDNTLAGNDLGVADNTAAINAQ